MFDHPWFHKTRRAKSPSGFFCAEVRSGHQSPRRLGNGRARLSLGVRSVEINLVRCNLRTATESRPYRMGMPVVGCKW